MIEALVKTLGAGLSIWQSKEKRKYVDKLIRLKREYYEEYNKEVSDDSVLDGLVFELELLGIAFASKVTESDIADK